MSFMASPRRTTVYLLHLLQKPQINHKMGQSVQEWTKYIFNRLSSAKFTKSALQYFVSNASSETISDSLKR